MRRQRKKLGRLPRPGAHSSSLVCCPRQAQNASMRYFLHAIYPETRESFTAEYETKPAALESAKSLRSHGMLVSIIGPDGKPVDETKTSERAIDRQPADHGFSAVPVSQPAANATAVIRAIVAAGRTSSLRPTYHERRPGRPVRSTAGAAVPKILHRLYGRRRWRMPGTPCTGYHEPQTPGARPMPFEPELIGLMRNALEDVMTRVPVEHSTPATKAYLAECILKAAAQGHTSYNELVTAAADQIDIVLSLFT
jgi:hypothetical protein